MIKIKLKPSTTFITPPSRTDVILKRWGKE